MLDDGNVVEVEWLAAGCRCSTLYSNLGSRLEFDDDLSDAVVLDASQIDCGAFQQSCLVISEHKHFELLVILLTRIKVLLKLRAELELRSFVTYRRMEMGSFQNAALCCLPNVSFNLYVGS